MILKTYDTILNDICDDFDKSIAPKRITRSNANIIYLLLKAYAKGSEVIQNIVVALRNKFDPANCEMEDLESIAKLVGTAKYLGSASGLNVTVKNTSKELAVLEPGIYTYKLDDDNIFTYNNPTNDDLAFGASKTQIFMSREIKPIRVTKQDNIAITAVREDGSDIQLPDGIVFSCADNNGLQGALPESDIEFRQRIVTGTNTATLLNKMETEINNLPYIYSCRLAFNDSTSPITIGSTVLNPYNLLVVIAGTPDEKVAEIVASYGVYETMQVDPMKYVDYKNDIFVTGYHRIYYMEPEVLSYDINIEYEIDAKAISQIVAQNKITEALEKFRSTNDYVPLLTEREFSNYIMSLGINTLQVLNVDFVVEDGESVDYIRVPRTQIARLRNVNFPVIL